MLLPPFRIRDRRLAITLLVLLLVQMVTGFGFIGPHLDKWLGVHEHLAETNPYLFAVAHSTIGIILFLWAWILPFFAVWLYARHLDLKGRVDVTCQDAPKGESDGSTRVLLSISYRTAVLLFLILAGITFLIAKWIWRAL